MEAMGAAASVVAFCQAASAIAATVIKAKQLWDQVKEVPEDISRLLEMLQQQAFAFSDIEKQLQNIPPVFRQHSSASRSLTSAEVARQALETLVDEMNGHLNCKSDFRRKRASFRIILKKDVMAKYKERLQEAVNSLQMSLDASILAVVLSNQITINRTHAVTTDILQEIQGPVKSQITALMRHRPQPYQDTTTMETKALASARRTPAKRQRTTSKFGRFAVSYSKDDGSWRACVRWPGWISQSIYEICSQRSVSGWMFCYRSYNIVPPDSEIMVQVSSGNTQGVMDLFNSGKASPYDRDIGGYSLLHRAAERNNYEVCGLLLKLGLQDLLTETVGVYRESPLSVVIHGGYAAKRERWDQLAWLFQSHLNASATVLTEMLFDFIRGYAYGDENVFHFQRTYLPSLRKGPIRDRVEAVRQGCFQVHTASTLWKLLGEDCKVHHSQVSLSTQEKLSLLHSAAIAFGIRFASGVVIGKKAKFQWGVYNDSWSEFVIDVASAADIEDLHAVETVRPWDVHHVPIWQGTPLMSVLGGALCHLSPETALVRWDDVFQKTLQQWLKDIQNAGVDLNAYGQTERELLGDEMKGAFDAEAIKRGRNEIRDVMALFAHPVKKAPRREGGWNENHWVPVRVIDIKIGPQPDDWRLLWAPEFEAMACQFWELVEREQCAMPGSWVED